MYHLVTIVRPDDDSTTELLVDELWRAGAVGVEEIDRSIRAAFTDTATATATSVALRHGGRVEVVADTTGLDRSRLDMRCVELTGAVSSGNDTS